MNKASGGDGITVELFQILKDDAGHWDTVITPAITQVIHHEAEYLTIHHDEIGHWK